VSDDPQKRYYERLLEARESELQAIRGSRTWRWLNALRAFKYRWVDRLLLRLPAPSLNSKVGSDPTLLFNVPDVVCLSIIDWDFRFQRPQQLMSQFANDGRRVLYVRRGKGPVVAKRDNVWEVSAADVQHAPLVIVQHPSWWPLAKQLGGTIVYDCMDEHAGFSTEVAAGHEEALLRCADLVVVSSARLAEKARGFAKNVLLLPNACDYEHFASTPRAGGPRPVIGYYGAISDWFDLDLVAPLAARRRDWDVLLIGATYGADVRPLTALPNVMLPGEQPYTSLPGWLGVIDVCIIPFVRNALTEATNPVKVYEMLAAGKPVVSVAIPEVAALVPLVRVASGVEAFEREIEAALREDSDAQADARRAFAREQTWGHRYAALRAALERL
jgi:glycosyltransferase involved in cell wall biosynthesis